MQTRLSNQNDIRMASRIFLGGLPPDVTRDDLAQRFQSFGKVIECEIIPDKLYNVVLTNKTEIFKRNFGYVSIEPKDENSLKRALQVYNGSKWRGSLLRCQLAKPTAIQRLKQEDDEDSRIDTDKVSTKTPLKTKYQDNDNQLLLYSFHACRCSNSRHPSQL